MREEFLELLRTDLAFREEVRRHLLTEELLALPREFEQLIELIREIVALLKRMSEEIQRLTEAHTRLERAMSELAQAQARTEERVGRLEERTGRLEEAMAELSQAQARTEEGMKRLQEAMAELAQAQARTEEETARMKQAIAELAQAQARTEERVEELAHAQLRMQEAVQALAQQVGWLSDAVGFTLEDLAREVTPAYLAQHYGIHVAELERRFFTLEGREIEVDLYGEGRRDGEPIVVIGEVRSRIYGRDVEAAVQRAQELRAHVFGTPVIVLFGFVIHPSAKDVARRLGAIVISSSGR